MKKFIMTKCMNYIKKNTNYDNIKLKEIEYGLVSIYLTISKMIIILIIAYFLGIFWETIIFSTIYNVLRIPSFGLHATKSWICLIISVTFFIGIPFLVKIIYFPIIIRIIVSIVGIFFMFKNSPADTKKRPIVNKKRRLKLKIMSTILATVFGILSILINNQIIVNYLIISLILQNIMISPVTYKIFKQPYNNYIQFLKTHPNYIN